MPRGMQDLNSSTRDGILAPCSGSVESEPLYRQEFLIIVVVFVKTLKSYIRPSLLFPFYASYSLTTAVTIKRPAVMSSYCGPALKCFIFVISYNLPAIVLLFNCQVVSDSLRPPWTLARQAPLSMGFQRQDYWSGLPFPSSGTQGLNPGLWHWPPGQLPGKVELLSSLFCRWGAHRSD